MEECITISCYFTHNFRDIGGSKISVKRAKEEKKAESDWEKWLTNQQLGRVRILSLIFVFLFKEGL